MVGAGAGVGAGFGRGGVVGLDGVAAAPVVGGRDAEGVVGGGGGVDEAAGADLVRVVAAAFGVVLGRFAVVGREVDEGFVVWRSVGGARGV